MIERALSFGADSGKVGILTEPAPEDATATAPAVLMWNVGIQHRVGPYRIQVDIARDLARRGFTSLRFDLSGMGDSAVTQDSRLDVERAVADARDAMDLIEKRRGTSTFLPIGFCSSVDSAHRLAMDDARVAGACFLEGYAYPTRGYWLRYPLRLLNRERWQRYVASRLEGGIAGLRRGLRVDPLREERAAMGSVFARSVPTREAFGGDVRQLAARGTKMLFVYVGGDTEFNHPGQFSEMIDGRPPAEVEIEYYDGADHTFFRVSDRERVVSRIGGWATRAFRDAMAVGASVASGA
ncbi:MAG: hypothetical protein ACREJ3_02765 [Polyangiaceae bacterium]